MRVPPSIKIHHVRAVDCLSRKRVVLTGSGQAAGAVLGVPTAVVTGAVEHAWNGNALGEGSKLQLAVDALVDIDIAAASHEGSLLIGEAFIEMLCLDTAGPLGRTTLREPAQLLEGVASHLTRSEVNWGSDRPLRRLDVKLTSTIHSCDL